MPALNPEQIERIVTLQEPAPQSHRSLTLERQIIYLERAINQLKAQCDPTAVVRTEQAARDSKGNLVLDKNGAPQVVAQTVLRRDTVGSDEKRMLENVRQQYREWLRHSNAERSEASERRRFDFEREQRRKKFEAHDAAEDAKAKHRDSRFMLAGDRD